MFIVILLLPVGYYLYEYNLPPSNPGHKRIIDMQPVNSVEEGVFLYLLIFFFIIMTISNYLMCI